LLALFGEGGRGPEREKFYWSTDLVNWTPSAGNYTATGIAQFFPICKAFGKWWSSGHYASLLVCSEDGGKSWNEVKAPVNSHANIFFFKDTLYYWGTDNPQDQLYLTTNGTNWQKSDKFRSLMGNGGLFWSSKA
jgi:photosystem II stability/assembly factor-like uncharacterized protein